LTAAQSALAHLAVETATPIDEARLQPDGSVQRAIQTWLIQWLSRTLNVAIAAIDPHCAFADYGIDSVMAVELAQDLQDTWTLNQELDATIAWNFPTIATLAVHLASLVQATPPHADSSSTAEPVPIPPNWIEPARDAANDNPDAQRQDSLDDRSAQEMADLLAQEIAHVRARAKP
jgi:acyl carrier protein